MLYVICTFLFTSYNLTFTHPLTFKLTFVSTFVHLPLFNFDFVIVNYMYNLLYLYFRNIDINNNKNKATRCGGVTKLMKLISRARGARPRPRFWIIPEIYLFLKNYTVKLSWWPIMIAAKFARNFVLPIKPTKKYFLVWIPP